MVKKIVKPVAGMIVGFALCFSSTVAAANVPSVSANYASASLSPFVALSAFGTMQSRSAVCAAAAGSAAAAAAAAEGQPSAQGCVLPVLDQPAPVDAVAPMAAPVAFVPADSGFRFGIGALIAGLVLVAGLAAVLASGHNNGRLPISPG